MRDPERLESFYNQLKDIHKKYFPDWRFGQLVSNFLGWVYSEKGADPFFPEEDEMLGYLYEFTSAMTGKEVH